MKNKQILFIALALLSGTTFLHASEQEEQANPRQTTNKSEENSTTMSIPLNITSEISEKLVLLNKSFTVPWDEKPIRLFDIQETPNYTWWPFPDITPFDKFKKLIADTENIKTTNNLAVLRCIAFELIETCLENKLFDIAKDTLELCSNHNIHLWTSYDIGITKYELRKKKYHTKSFTKDKNKIA
jgi:hypothetical protein